jgi:hypothetical protein
MLTQPARPKLDEQAAPATNKRPTNRRKWQARANDGRPSTWPPACAFNVGRSLPTCPRSNRRIPWLITRRSPFAPNGWSAWARLGAESPQGGLAVEEATRLGGVVPFDQRGHHFAAVTTSRLRSDANVSGRHRPGVPGGRPGQVSRRHRRDPTLQRATGEMLKKNWGIPSADPPKFMPADPRRCSAVNACDTLPTPPGITASRRRQPGS